MKSCNFAGPEDEFVVSGSDDFRIYLWKTPTNIVNHSSAELFTMRNNKNNRDLPVVFRPQRHFFNQTHNNNHDRNHTFCPFITNPSPVNTSENSKEDDEQQQHQHSHQLQHQQQEKRRRRKEEMRHKRGKKRQQQTQTQGQPLLIHNERDHYHFHHHPYRNHYLQPDTCGKVTKTHSILTGHRSIVNNIRYHPHLPLMVSSGVEKVIKLWIPFKMKEEQEGYAESQSCRTPFSRSDFDFFLREILNGREEFEETTNESKETLALFDFFNGAEQDVDQTFYDLHGEYLGDDEELHHHDLDDEDCAPGEECFPDDDDCEDDNESEDEEEEEDDDDDDNDDLDNDKSGPQSMCDNMNRTSSE